MMLGIAASNSITNDTGARIQIGAYSAMNSAHPTPIGVARSSAIKDVTTVPYTYAAAPNFSATGSQVVWVRKAPPDRNNAGSASSSRRMTMPSNMSGTRLAAGEGWLAVAGDLLDELLALRVQRIGHGRVGEVLVELLTFMCGPPRQPREGDRLGLVGHVLVQQQPRCSGDRIRGVARRVDDAEPQVGGYVRGIRRCRRGHALQ